MDDIKKRPAEKKKSAVKRKQSSLRKFVKSAKFSKAYVVFALLVVLATTLYWSLLGAKIQLGNADQLVNADLFGSYAIFHAATFPGAHTFLLKWPIFLLIKIFGSTGSLIDGVTVAVVLATVGSLVAFIHKIERRPLVFGTICLALASVLLMIPAEPYAGAILPLNMAMLATRNIEYIIFIVGLAAFIRSPRIRSWGFWLSAVCLALLIATDKFFLIFTVGGAAIALIIYARSKNWNLVSLAVNWLIISAIAAVGAIILLNAINASGITHLASQSSASPYSLATTPKLLRLGVLYAVLGVFTNFGANPAYDATIVRDIPHHIFSGLFSPSGPAYVVNLAILAIGLFAVYKIVTASWRVIKRKKNSSLDKSTLLSIMLIWSSVAAIASFVATNHYYAVDARYLTLLLFAVFISFASFARSKKWQPEHLAYAGLVLTISIIFGFVGATRSYDSDRNALAPQNNANTVVAQVLAQHHENILVGDYWRVVPIKQVAASNLNIMPLSNCGQTRQLLNSTAWQPNLHKTGFAYLLTLHGSLTNYPDCTLKQVVSAYGKPNASALIAGTLSNPDQVLLFYDRGIHERSSVVSTPSRVPATIEPTSLSNLTNTSCSVPSVMNIVAHEDDDLLFMNPDLYNEIKAGDCVRTVYVTAGNAGAGEYYWLSREQGSEAAYSYMLGTNSIWIQKIVELAPNEFITVASPKGNTKISLIFMYLPDGNLKGQGYSSSNFESLAKLQTGKITVINAVDHQSYYTSATLISALSTLMNVYQTSTISTQANVAGQKFPDHSDHLAVSWYTKQAYAQFETQRYANQLMVPIKYYIGYPIRELPVNVLGVALQEKDAIFLAYAKHDGNVCQTLQACLQTPTYNGYLDREYQSTD